MGNYISASSALPNHECSARNITWQYLRHNGTLNYPYNTCTDAQLILDSHCCSLGKCHPAPYFDVEWGRYAWYDWDGLGDPYQGAEPGKPSMCVKGLAKFHAWKRSKLPIQVVEKSSHKTKANHGISNRLHASPDHQQTGFMRPGNTSTGTDLAGQGRKKYTTMPGKNGTVDEPHWSSDQPQTGFQRPDGSSNAHSKNRKGKAGRKSHKKPHEELGNGKKPSFQDPIQHRYKPDHSLLAPNPFNGTTSSSHDIQKSISGPKFTDQYARHGDHHMSTGLVVSGVLIAVLIFVLGLVFWLWYKKARKPRWMREYRRVKRANVGPWDPRAEEETLVDDWGSVNWDDGD